jgi:hypothetical protein
VAGGTYAAASPARAESAMSVRNRIVMVCPPPEGHRKTSSSHPRPALSRAHEEGAITLSPFRVRGAYSASAPSGSQQTYSGPMQA